MSPRSPKFWLAKAPTAGRPHAAVFSSDLEQHGRRRDEECERRQAQRADAQAALLADRDREQAKTDAGDESQHVDLRQQAGGERGAERDREARREPAAEHPREQEEGGRRAGVQQRVGVHAAADEAEQR